MINAHRSTKRSLALLGALAAVFLLNSLVQQSNGSGDHFCSARVAKDYLRPLTSMAPIRRVPSSGKLPFAPIGLTLEAEGGTLVVGQGAVGFGFSDEAVGKVRRLNWDVRARLTRVDRRGEDLAMLDSKRRQIGSVKGNQIKSLQFEVSGKPAYYRVDISFRRLDNQRLLGEFSRYVRGVRSHFDARLLVSAPVVHRSESIAARLANFGTETVSSIFPDWRFAVQYFDGEKWVPAAFSPSPVKHKPLVRKLSAGKMDDCFRLHVPSSEKAGRYRFSATVSRPNAPDPDREVELLANFEIDGRILK